MVTAGSINVPENHESDEECLMMIDWDKHGNDEEGYYVIVLTII